MFIYSAALPAGPFANTPHWSEDFDQPGTSRPMPDYWQLFQEPDPANSWTEVNNSQAALRNNGVAIGVPVWTIFDNMLPPNILSGLEQQGESPTDYLQRRGGSPFFHESPCFSSHLRKRFSMRMANLTTSGRRNKSSDALSSSVELSVMCHLVIKRKFFTLKASCADVSTAAE